MEYVIRLAEILDFDSKRRGVIKDVCDHTGLERHLVADMLHGKTNSISMKTLTKLCDYLVQHKGIAPETLPGRLFGRGGKEFWEVLAAHRSIDMVYGVRLNDPLTKEKKKPGPEDYIVSGADILLQADLLHGITSAANVSYTESVRSDHDEGNSSPGQEDQSSSLPPSDDAGQSQAHRFLLRQHFVASPREDPSPEVLLKESQSIYQHYDSRRGDKTLVCLGSVKSNPVTELVLARTFGVQPFISQDSIPKVAKRDCPVFFLYRKSDAAPPSCCGGEKLASGDGKKKPGIYFETATGKWACCLSTPKQGAALVFFDYYPGRGQLEVVIGGFSGRDTWYVARALSNNARNFWPPSFSKPDRQIGMFILQIDYWKDKRGNVGNEPPPPDGPAKVKVIPLATEALASRIK